MVQLASQGARTVTIVTCFAGVLVACGGGYGAAPNGPSLEASGASVGAETMGSKESAEAYAERIAMLDAELSGLIARGPSEPPPEPAFAPTSPRPDAEAESDREQVAEPEAADALSSERSSVEEPAEAGAGPADAGADPCGSAPSLRDRICDLAQRICGLAEAHPDDAELQAQCESATGSCDRARRDVTHACGL